MNEITSKEYFFDIASEFYFVCDMHSHVFTSYSNNSKIHYSDEISKHSNLLWESINIKEDLESLTKSIKIDPNTAVKLKSSSKKEFIENYDSIKAELKNYCSKFGNTGMLIAKRDNSYKIDDI